MNLPALLDEITPAIQSTQDPERVYDLNVRLTTRREYVALLRDRNPLLEVWRTLSIRLETEDEQNRDTREAAASSILDQVTTASGPAATPEMDPLGAQLYELVTQLARLTRDLLPGLQEAKAVVRECEPYLRRILYRITTFDRIKEEELIPAHRAILQALSNLVAPVTKDPEGWVTELWRTYTLGPREDAVLIRAMDSDDPMTFVSCIMLTLNFIRAESGIKPSLATAGYRPLVAKILDKVGAYSDAESGSAEERCFHLGYQLFSMLFHQGLQGSLFTLLSSPTEPITPSQTTLLQLLDGYHHSSDWDSPAPSPHNETYAFLIPAFYDLARYAVAAMTPGVPRNGRDLEDDPKLARVLEAAIVVCQCLITVCLAETEHLAIGDELLSAVREAKEGERQFVEVLIDLLRTTETFIPRVKPFRPNDPTRTDQADASGLAGFATLKRDLVQLAGLLANDHTPTQDAIRELGGMQVILSMCVTDDRNPLIREYALLAVRNLMINNVANQAVIKEMDPLGVVGPDGELREMPARMGVGK
ncbi:hypothetical protein NCC49_001178 [Naganishia albida]|nr:hypothetical protein NCC49_001178 [Naganishia albida]